jgi:TolA-binding protein
MNMKFKLAAYAVLLLLAAGFGWGFYANYKAVTPAPPTAPIDVTAPAATNNSVPATNSAPPVQTNAALEAAAAAPPSAHAKQGAMMAYLAAMVGALVGLGLMIAHDVTQFAGNVAVDALLDVGDAATRDPDYEKAEEAWAKGKHMEAIEILRDFLKKNPRAQYAALRIAEIYEKDLRNHLAAALEYEEVLKHKLPAERWGWAAVHLCNLYSKLGQQDKAKALLQRIVDEYPQTAAAKKARSHLGLPEPEPMPEPEPPPNAGTAGTTAEPVQSAAPAAKEQPSPESPAPPPPPPKSNLPPGFRPKSN